MGGSSKLGTQSTPNGDGKKNDSKDGNDDIEVDNSKSVLLKIATLYAEQLMSDITLVVDGVGYPAHRLILCATSEVFQVMLMKREWSEWSESRVVLQETSQCAVVFPHFLRYFYTGQIKISHQTVLPVLCLADKYNVKDLVSLCVCYMSQHVAHAAQRGQLVAWLQYTMACGHHQVAQACQRFVKWNIEMVAETSDFVNFEPEVLIWLLQQNDLVVHNEMALYNFVMRWLVRQKERLTESDCSAVDLKAHWDSLVLATLSHIRFPMMSPRELANVLLSPFIQEQKDFFVDRMAIAMSYQSDQTERVREVWQTEEGRLLFTPRLYTEDTWGSLLAIEHFHSLPCYHTRTFLFSSRTCLAESTDNTHTKAETCEWMVDLYPKGVWFKKSLLIVWAGTYEVPEVVLRTVRIAITCRDPPPIADDQFVDRTSDGPDIRVKIGVVVWGVQRGVEHVASVVERVHRFSAQHRVFNIDGALDFDELNTPLYTPHTMDSSRVSASVSSTSGAAATSGGKRCRGHGDDCTCNPDAISSHLVGPNRDQLRIQVVIIPLTEVCCVGANLT